MERLITQWKRELIEAGMIKPDQEISNEEIAEMYQSYQIEKVKSMLGGDFVSMSEDGLEIKKPEGLREVSAGSSEGDDALELRTGMKKSLDALLTVAKGANYCMFVVDKAWINFRYRKSKDNLHLQVAGNQYISPMNLSDSDIEYLEGIGIPPEEGSNDIWSREFDDNPRDLDAIVDTIVEIFNEVYHIDDGTSAYIELDLAKGEDESVRKGIAQYFRRRDGKQFKFKWNRGI